MKRCTFEHLNFTR